MRRIIYSIYNDNVDQNHKSTDDYKISQFRKYKEDLIRCKEEYANVCDADFILIETPTTDYNNIQFEKIKLLEEYAKDYDEVMYLDFDVVPTHYAPNLFESADMNTICMHPLQRELKGRKLREALNRNGVDNQTVFIKTCAKNSMLLLEGVIGSDRLYNTGVIAGNSDVISQLNFTNRIDYMNDLLLESADDSLYPPPITNMFYINNEVFISYIIEMDNIPHTNLSLSWNFILDGYQHTPTAAAYMVHHVNKDFQLSFSHYD